MSIEDCKTVNIIGLTQTQKPTFSLTFDLHSYYNFNLELFMNIAGDRIHNVDSEEHIHCRIIKVIERSSFTYIYLTVVSYTRFIFY